MIIHYILFNEITEYNHRFGLLVTSFILLINFHKIKITNRIFTLKKKIANLHFGKIQISPLKKVKRLKMTPSRSWEHFTQSDFVYNFADNCYFYESDESFADMLLRV